MTGVHRLKEPTPCRASQSRSGLDRPKVIGLGHGVLTWDNIGGVAVEEALQNAGVQRNVHARCAR